MGNYLKIRNSNFEDVKVDTVNLQNYYTVDAVADPNNAGRFEGIGVYSENQNACLATYSNEGFMFDGWSDGETYAIRNVIVNEDKNFQANFVTGQDWLLKITNYYQYENSFLGPLVFFMTQEYSEKLSGKTISHIKVPFGSNTLDNHASILIGICDWGDELNTLTTLANIEVDGNVDTSFSSIIIPNNKCVWIKCSRGGNKIGLCSQKRINEKYSSKIICNRYIHESTNTIKEIDARINIDFR